MSKKRNMLKVRVFALIWIIVVVVCTLFVLKLIYNLWFPPFLEQSAVSEKLPLKAVQMAALTEGIQPDGYHVAHKSVTDEIARDRFHDWEIPSPKDKVSVCINCHGNIPHNKDERTRAFLNKHDMYMACETCHMPTGGEFAWYDVETGELKKHIPVNAPLRISHYKLVVVGRILPVYKNDELMKASDAFLKEAADLSADERKKGLERFHMSKLETPLDCRSCHTGQRGLTSFIPFQSIGYSEVRSRQIVNSEVVGMVENYEVFYLPTFLVPQQRGPLP